MRTVGRPVMKNYYKKAIDIAIQEERKRVQDFRSEQDDYSPVIDWAQHFFNLNDGGEQNE